MKIILHLFFLMLIFSLANCDNKSIPSLRIAHISWPGYEPLSLAKTRNLYRKIDVKTYRPSNNTEAILAFENNVVDVVAVTLNHAIEMQSRSDESLMIIAVLDISHGGDVIIANKSIKSINDLKGKRLGIEPTALGAYFVSRAIEKSKNISIKDIFIVPVDINLHDDLFLANKVDAIATYGPIKSDILKQSGHIVFDSSQIPNEILDVLVTKVSYATENPFALTELMNGYFSALSLIKNKPDEAIYEMAKFENIMPDDYVKLLSGIKIPGKEENIKLLNNESDLLTSISKLQSFLYKRLIITSNKATLKITDQFISKKLR